MHKAVRNYCEGIKKRFPGYFNGKDVLDCGSLDINGNNRYLFSGGTYLGIDICPGKNVDVVVSVDEFEPERSFDVVISTEMLEHNEKWLLSLRNMARMTRYGGLLMFTAAGTNRPVHGTTTHNPQDSPKTNEYYHNITAEMIVQAFDLDEFAWFEISYVDTDIRFAGIKR